MSAPAGTNPFTQGEMEQFTKRVEARDKTVNKSIDSLTNVVSKLAETTQEMLGEHKAMRGLVDRLMEEQSKRSDEMALKVNDTDKRMKEFQDATSIELETLKGLVSALEVKAKGNTKEIEDIAAQLAARLADKLDWQMWRKRLGITSCVSIVVFAIGVLIRNGLS